MRVIIASTLLTLILLTGCTPATIEERLANAKQQISEENYESAAIILKNVVTDDPTIGEVRFLLGRAYYGLEAMDLATKEFDNAIERSFASDVMMAMHLQALKQQYLFQNIINFPINAYEPLSEEMQVHYAAYLIFALIYDDNMAKAKEVYLTLTDAMRESVYGRLANAYITLKEGDESGTLEIISSVLADQPNLADALLLKGQVSLSTEQYTDAIDSFKSFLTLFPNNPQVKLLLITSYFRNEDMAIAYELTQPLIKEFPNNAILNQVMGIHFFNEENFESAQIHLNKAFQEGLNTPYIRVFLGVTHLQFGQPEQAYKHFLNAASQLPANANVKRLLALTQTLLGRNAEAAESYKQIGKIHAGDFTSVAANTYQLMNEGNIALAEESLKQLDNLDNKTSEQYVQQGLLKLGMQQGGALDDLRKALELNPNLAEAKQAMISAELLVGNESAAVKLLEKMLAESEQTTDLFTFAGGVYAQIGDLAKAKDSFLAALELDPENPNTLFLLGSIEKELENMEAAREYLVASLQRQPNSYETLVTLFKVSFSLDDDAIEDVQNRVLAAYDNDKESMRLRLLAAYTYIAKGDFEDAESELAQYTNVQGLPGAFWQLYGDSLLYQRKLDQAISVYQQWFNKDPRNQTAALRLINALDIDQQFAQADRLSNQLQHRFKQEKAYSLLGAYFKIRQNKFEEASTLLKSLPEEQQSSILGQGILGVIKLAQQENEASLPLLQAFHEAYQNSYSTEVLAFAYKESNQIDKAIEVYQTQVDRSPSDQKSLSIQASLMKLKSPEKAKLLYQQLIDINPQNVFALNNLAEIHYAMGEYEDSANFARAAFQLVPDNLDVRDTYAKSLGKMSQFEESLRIYSEAMLRKGFKAEHRINYAEVALESGNVELAINLLNEVKTGDEHLLERVKQLKLKL